MLRITRDTWGGNDYLPYVWDEWLEDPGGLFMAAVIDGRLAGLQHAALMSDGTAWLEGIRVDPDLQGRGVGSMLLDAGVQWARTMACPAVRLSTSDQNPASNRMATSKGFLQVASFRTAEAEQLLSGSPGDVRVGLPSELPAVFDFLQEQGAKFYTEGWTAYRLTPDRVALLLATGSIALVGEQALEAAAVATFTGRRPILRLGLLAGSADGMERIARWLPSRAAGAGLTAVRAQVLQKDGALEAMSAAGYRTDFEHAMLLYELGLT
jgi:GNAT superfamily N-acetyltransferase